MPSAQVKKINSVNLTPQQHIYEADVHIANSEDLQDVASAQLEADIAMAHLMAAGVKLCMGLLGGKRASGGMAALSLISKLAK